MELGNLGKQIVIISKKAFDRLHFEGFETANRLEYFTKRKARDEKAREEYSNNTRKSGQLTNDVFVIDIIRKGVKNGDSII